MQENDDSIEQRLIHGAPKPPGAQQAPPNGGRATRDWLHAARSSTSYTNVMLTVIAGCLLVLTYLTVNVTHIKWVEWSGYGYVRTR